jgi:dimethylsulfide dehydrogenase subunit gamma
VYSSGAWPWTKRVNCVAGTVDGRSGNDTVQNLAAGGPGSTTMLEEQPVSGASLYYDNNDDPNDWTVVMSRPIKAEGAHNVSLNRDVVPMAFALWQGAEKQRDGLKRVSDGWILLDLTSD